MTTVTDAELADYFRQVRTLTEREVAERAAEHDHDDWTPAELHPEWGAS